MPKAAKQSGQKKPKATPNAQLKAAPPPVTAVATIVSANVISNAIELDRDIDEKIAQFTRDLAASYVRLGQVLSRMQESKGFLHLKPGFASWEAYLQSKKDVFGRTYCAYLLKIGQASGIDEHLADISAAQLIEYAKLVKSDKIVPLITATKKKVATKSARETATVLKEFIESNPGRFRREVNSENAGRPRTPWINKLERQYKSLRVASANDADDFVSGMRELLRRLDASESGTRKLDNARSNDDS